MTDEQIIKALSNISYGGHSCMKCKQKITKGDNRCGLKGCYIARLAIDIINRQKAESKKQITRTLRFFVNKLKWNITYHKKGEKFSVKMCKDIIDNLLKEMESENK